MHRHMIISRQYKPECLKRRWRDFFLVHKEVFITPPKEASPVLKTCRGHYSVQLCCNSALFITSHFFEAVWPTTAQRAHRLTVPHIFCSASINNNSKSRKMQKLEWLETIAVTVQALAACLGLTDQLLIEPSLSMQMFANSQCHTGSSD